MAVVSLLLIYDKSGDLQLWSPSLVVCLLCLIMSKEGRELLLDRTNLILLSVVALCVIANPSAETKEALRFVYVLGGVSVASRMRIGCNQRLLLVLLFSLLAIELALRIISGNLSDLDLYSIKGSGGLFADSNFTATIIYAAIVAFIERRELRKYLPTALVFLLLTFSRTGWLIAGFYLL